MYNQVALNKTKSFFSIFLFFILIVAAGYFIGFYLDYRYGFGSFFSIIILAAAFIFALATSFTGYFNSDKLVLQMTGAREISRDSDTYVYYITEGLAIAAGIPKPKVYIIEEKGMNAFATGRNPENSAVVLSRGLIENLNKEELRGVISHEISHIKNYDVLLGTIIVVFVGMLSILSNVMLRGMFFGGGRRSSRKTSGGAFGLVLLILGLILIILSPLIATLIRLAISRNREFLADSNGALISRYPAGLANALKKISMNSGISSATSATSHLFISNPLTEKNKPLFSSLFNTHPPVEERIKRLEGMSLGIGIN